MKNNGNKECPFADEILSYIYNEIDAFARGKFETHLADCVVCTDEFAAISHARFSVFEWQKEEFAHLATPEIVIPYGATQNSVVENASMGFLAGLRGLLSIRNWPVAVAAALLVCLGLGFLAMNYIGRGDQQIAFEVDNQSVPPVVSPDNSVDPDVTKIPQGDVSTASNNSSSRRETRPGRVTENRRTRPDRQTTAGTQKSVNNVRASQVPKAPVLYGYDDNDDKSLRLTDLFDDDGGGL